MQRAALALELGIASAWLASAGYVHFRGRVRHRLGRQLFDHSSFLAPYSAFVYFASRQRGARFFDVRDFPELAPLREHWKEIRDEAESLLAGHHIREAERRDDIAFNAFFRRGWKRFYVKWYGNVMPSAAQRCPHTVALLSSIPTVHAALFALLPPGARLGQHRDPFAGSLRYHLGLVTPGSDACRLWVDGEEYAWRDGEDVLFDETFVHWARNDTDQARIILFCDVERPLRWRWARSLNRWVIDHVVKITASNNEEVEGVGALNRVAGRIFAVQAAAKRFKRAHRGAYRLLRGSAVAALVALAGFLLVLCAR